MEKEVLDQQYLIFMNIMLKSCFVRRIELRETIALKQFKVLNDLKESCKLEEKNVLLN